MFLLLFLRSPFFSNERHRGVDWMGGDVGRTGKSTGRGKCNEDIRGFIFNKGG